jgi:hypothetical protein
MAGILERYANMVVVPVLCTGRVTEKQGHGPFNSEKVWYDLGCFVSGHTGYRRSDAVREDGWRVYMTQGGREER